MRYHLISLSYRTEGAELADDTDKEASTVQGLDTEDSILRTQ